MHFEIFDVFLFIFASVGLLTVRRCFQTGACPFTNHSASVPVLAEPVNFSGSDSSAPAPRGGKTAPAPRLQLQEG